MKLIQNNLLRRFVFAAGLVSLVLGSIGIFVPLLPTAPFLILTAWCFVRSSEKAHTWLYRQPYLSKALRDWDNSRAISSKSKALALTMICASMLFVWVTLPVMLVKILLSVILLTVSTFIITRPTP